MVLSQLSLSCATEGQTVCFPAPSNSRPVDTVRSPTWHHIETTLPVKHTIGLVLHAAGGAKPSIQPAEPTSTAPSLSDHDRMRVLLSLREQFLSLNIQGPARTQMVGDRATLERHTGLRGVVSREESGIVVQSCSSARSWRRNKRKSRRIGSRLPALETDSH